MENLCAYNAPRFAYRVGGARWMIGQGCCNHWDCPRCGLIRARQEYGRIVVGLRVISKLAPIYFITLTCRGREMSKAEADENYMKWTNRFLTAARAKSKRAGQYWAYVQVTERQRRGHAHSHILTLFNPGDIVAGEKKRWRIDNAGIRRWEVVRAETSAWVQREVVRSGLGSQYDISTVDTVEGASRYVAKYLFKPSIFENIWPKSWKRVRYSQSFPKLPEFDKDVIVLVAITDWQELARRAVVVTTTTLDDFDYVSYALARSDCVVRFAA